MAVFSKAEEGLIDTNGYRTYYKKVDDGRNLRPIVFLHGGPGASHDYLLSLSALGSERPVIFYDQFGSGRSDGRQDPARWQVSTFVEQLAMVLSKLGLNDVHLYGHSWGGMLALEYMRTKPQGVKTLTLGSTMVDIPLYTKHADELLLQISLGIQALARKHEKDGTVGSPEYQEVMNIWNRTHIWHGTRPPRLESYGGFNDKQYIKMWGPSEFGVTGDLKAWSAQSWMPEITQPSFVIAGEYDEVTPAMAERSAQLLPNAYYEIIEDGAHVVHAENPRSYLRALRAFLQEHDD